MATRLPSDVCSNHPHYLITSMSLVPNYSPVTFNRIAIIGEAPSNEDQAEGRPFSGYAGKHLQTLSGSVGINLQNCYLGNVAQYRPSEGDMENLVWSGKEVHDGLAQLRQDLVALQPNMVVLLGNAALKAAKDPLTDHPLKTKRFKYSVSDWRGSLFRCEHESSPFYGFKCMSAYHPAACLRNYEWTPLLRFDLHKAAAEGKTSELTLPVRVLRAQVDASYILSRLAAIKENKTFISFDIEGYVGDMTCLSIAESQHEAFIIPFVGEAGNFFTEDEEVLVWRALADVLSDPSIPKVLQNSLYDCFVFLYSYGILVRGVVDDTMLKHWEAYCELPKGLGFLCSLYTREPFYKHERKTEGLVPHWIYCCRDSAVTYEINQVLETRLTQEAPRLHYRRNVELLQPLLYMEKRGIRYDIDGAAKRQAEVLRECHALNYELDQIGLSSFDFSLDASQARAEVRKIAGYKRGPGWKKEYQEDVPFLEQCLSSWPPVDFADRGRFNAALGTGINIKSPQFKTLLYDIFGLPKQYGKEGQLSTDYEALLNLWKKSNHPATKLGIDISARRTRAQMLGITADPDGRIRCGYNLVGTETGRLTCYTSPTGSGYNLQTIPEKDRDLFLADDGCWLFQCDLSGADSWTVAAHLAFLGEPTMLDDLLAGIKPAKVLALMRRHGAEINNLSRADLLKRCDEVKKSDWDYFASKIGIHGTCYLMGARTLGNKIFLESEGNVHLTEAETKLLQGLCKTRYRVPKWHNWTERQLALRPELQSASGHVRRFFGRRDEILGEALAHEPQINTTYATNLAMWRLWTDPDNKRPDGGLYVEPLHSVHDALVGQFPKAMTAWAVPKIREWFNNPIRIANKTLVIPFEGAYGESWGKLKEGKI